MDTIKLRDNARPYFSVFFAHLENAYLQAMTFEKSIRTNV